MRSSTCGAAAPASGPAVPPTSSASSTCSSANNATLGILTAESLQCILRPTATSSTLCAAINPTRCTHNERDDVACRGPPASASLLSPYDPRFTPAASSLQHLPASPLQPHRHDTVIIPTTTTNRPHHHHSRIKPTDTSRRKRAYCITNKKLQPLAHNNNNSNNARQLTLTQPSIPQRQRQLQQNALDSTTSTSSNSKLQNELAWIRLHLPVLQLASTHNSLALRQQLFATTFVTHVTRALLRQRWCVWQAVVAALQRSERNKRRAATQLVALWIQRCRSLQRDRFSHWRRTVRTQQSLEELAARVTLQLFVRRCRQQSQQQQQQQQQLRIAMALAAARHTHATTLQRFVRHQLHRRHCQRQRIEQPLQQDVPARAVAAAAAHALVRALHSTGVSTAPATASASTTTAAVSDRLARTIQRTWRRFMSQQQMGIVQQCAASLIDSVEWNYRQHKQRRHNAARVLHRSWRQWLAQRAFVDRRIDKQQMRAACCLQRSFRLYRQQLQQHNKATHAVLVAMQDRFVPYEETVAAAAARIQRSWKRRQSIITSSHARNHVMTQSCATAAAATSIQHMWKRQQRLYKWHSAVARNTLQHECFNRQWQHAALRIQRYWRMRQLQSIEASSTTVATAELTALLSATVSLQRLMRRRIAHQHDAWRSVLHRVLRTELPQYRVAVMRIAICYRSFRCRKQALLQRFAALPNGSNSIQSSLHNGKQNLGALRALLQTQQLQLLQAHAAANCIQRAVRRRIDRRNGRVLLRQYKIALQRELRLRAQRQVVHSYLDSRAQQRAQWQQQRAAKSKVQYERLQVSVGDSEQQQQQLVVAAITDDPDVQQCWSDEHQRAYTYNARTGESAWL